MSQPLVLRFDVEDNGSVKMERINSNLDTLGKKLGQTAEKSSYFDRVFARVSKAFSAVQSAIFSLQGAFVALGISMTAAGFIKTAAAMETMQTKMIQMTGSVEAGNQMFRLATKYGAETTYSVMESMSSLVALKSAVSSLDIGMLEKLVKVAGDLAARSPVKMSLEESMGQVIRMWSAGASAADMFREKGILAMLGFKTKVEYTVEETRKKLMEAWEDPEKRIKGAAQSLAGTWDGIVSMIGDKWDALVLIIMRAGIFDALKDQLKAFDASFGQWTEKNRASLVAFGRDLASGFKLVAEAVKVIVGHLGDLALALEAVMAYKLAGWVLAGEAAFALATKAIMDYTFWLAKAQAAIIVLGQNWTKLGMILKTSAVGAVILGTVEALLYLRHHSELTAQIWAKLWFTMWENSERSKTDVLNVIDQMVYYLKAKFTEALEWVINKWNDIQGLFNKILPDSMKFNVAYSYTSTKDIYEERDRKIAERNQRRDNYIAEMEKQKNAMISGAFDKVAEEDPQLQEARRRLEELRKKTDQAAGNTEKMGEGAGKAAKEFTAADRALAGINNKLEAAKSSIQFLNELDQRRVELERPTLAGGQMVNPLSREEQVRNATSRQLQLNRLEEERLKAQLAVERSKKAEGVDQGRILELEGQIKTLAEERQRIPVLADLDAQKAKLEGITRELDKQLEVAQRAKEAGDQALQLEETKRAYAQEKTGRGLGTFTTFAQGAGFGPLASSLAQGIQEQSSLEDANALLGRRIQLEVDYIAALDRTIAKMREKGAAEADLTQKGDELSRHEMELKNLNLQRTQNNDRQEVASKQAAMAAITGFLDQGATMAAQMGKRGAALAKAMAISSTIIKTYEAAMSIYAAVAKGSGFMGLGAVAAAQAAAGMTIGFGMAQVAQIAAAPTMHTGGLVQSRGLKSDEVNRTLQVGEYVVSRRGVEALDKVNRGEVAKPESSGASQGVTIYNLIEEEQILAIMNTEKGENVIVNRIKVNHDKSGPMRTLIRNGGKA